MNRLNRATLAVALCVVAIGSAMAQPREGKPANIGAYKELFGTLKTWAQSNVMPQLRTWKSKLDGSMSAEDLAALNALRARAAQLHKDVMATGMAMHQAWKAEDYDGLKQNRDKMKGYDDARKAIFQELKPLAMKYKSTLEAIGTEAKPKIEAWKKEGKEMAMKWIQAHKDQLGDAGFPHMGHMGGMMNLDNDMKRKMAAARFMLWNGDDFMEHMQGMGGDASGVPPELK